MAPKMSTTRATGKSAAKSQGRPERESPKGHWCGTLNNPTVRELAALWRWHPPLGPVPAHHKLSYWVVGWEHRDRSFQTPHLQIYIELADTKIRAHQINEWFRRAHFEARRGTPQQAADYCKKEGVWREWGTLSTGGVHLQPHQGITQTWQDLIDKVQAHPTFAGVTTDPEIAGRVSKMMQWARTVWEARPQRARPLDMLAPGFKWQARFSLFLMGVEPDDRMVTYVYNERGNAGKSRFVKYMVAEHGLMYGCPDDFKATATLWQGQRAALFDVARSQALRYDIIETVKDGFLLQTKYDES